MSDPISEPMKVARYTCGYCATSYATLKEAEDCLARDQEACKEKHLNRDPEDERTENEDWVMNIDDEYSPWDFDEEDIYFDDEDDY